MSKGLTEIRATHAHTQKCRGGEGLAAQRSTLLSSFDMLVQQSNLGYCTAVQAKREETLHISASLM